MDFITDYWLPVTGIIALVTGLGMLFCAWGDFALQSDDTRDALKWVARAFFLSPVIALILPIAVSAGLVVGLYFAFIYAFSLDKESRQRRAEKREEARP